MGVRHDWLEGRGPYLTLIGAVDDATGTIPYALFGEQEDAHGYFLLTERVIRDKGIPLALYSEEQLAGERSPTQFGRAMRELGIESVLAQSPQAKGRVERMWGTLQDRLVSLLRLEGASCIEDANRVLASVLPEVNEHFGVAPRQAGSAYRQMPEGLVPESVLCFKYMRTVANDNTIRFANRTIQLLPDMQRMSYARARVEVQERLRASGVTGYFLGVRVMHLEGDDTSMSWRLAGRFVGAAGDGFPRARERRRRWIWEQPKSTA